MQIQPGVCLGCTQVGMSQKNEPFRMDSMVDSEGRYHSSFANRCRVLGASWAFIRRSDVAHRYSRVARVEGEVARTNESAIGRRNRKRGAEIKIRPNEW